MDAANTKSSPQQNADEKKPVKRRREPTSTVGRGKAVIREQALEAEQWSDELTTISFGDSLSQYDSWDMRCP